MTSSCGLQPHPCFVYVQHGKWSTVDLARVHVVQKMFRAVASSSRLFRGVRQRAVHSATLSTTAAAHRAETGSNDEDNSKKIYELRTYAIRPDKFGEYLKVMEENIGLRTAHSKLLGFWITDLGGINEVNHLWEYGNETMPDCMFPFPYSNTPLINIILSMYLESYQHRADVRKALTLDKNWNEKCFSKILPMFVSQVGIKEDGREAVG